MSRRDTYHYSLKRALVKDGWQITHDPFPLIYGGASVSTDLGAQRTHEIGSKHIAVELIAVEIKDFDEDQMMSVFEKALGQYRLYHTMLNRLEPQRVLYLAIRNEAWLDFFQRPAVQDVLADNDVLLIIFDEQREEILQWIK